MRKKLTGITVLMATVLTLATGCTRNNGDIGLFFGSWLLTEIKADGTTDEDYAGNAVWAFQSGVVKMTMVYPWHETSGYFGTWSEHDGYLELDYTHSSADMEAGTGDYSFPPGLHLPAYGRVTMRIDRLTSKEMELSYSSDGAEYTYNLKKQY